MTICKIKNCNLMVGSHGAKGMCPKHYREYMTSKRECSHCGELKNIYGNTDICAACYAWEKRNNRKNDRAHMIITLIPKNNPSEYQSYRAMIDRCFNKNRAYYKNYGGRGITVCDRWLGLHGFVNFLADMGKKFDGGSLDRIDVNGNYEPSNCRWADKHTQMANRRIKRKYSKCVGVTYDKKASRWKASITVNKRTYSKNASTEREAISIRKQFERTLLN